MINVLTVNIYKNKRTEDRDYNTKKQLVNKKIKATWCQNVFSYTFLKCFTFRTKEFVDQSIYGIDKIANIVISRLEISYHTKIIKQT